MIYSSVKTLEGLVTLFLVYDMYCRISEQKKCNKQIVENFKAKVTSAKDFINSKCEDAYFEVYYLGKKLGSK